MFSNTRTAIASCQSLRDGFSTAFTAGTVMGFSLVGLGLLALLFTIVVFEVFFESSFDSQSETLLLFECIAGYGLGGSSIALFGRVGGGIYTKAADVGADLVGKVEKDIPEDDPRNPAVIVDNVGDNVGDIAGMGADLFGSLAEATCAAMVISAQSSLFSSYNYMLFPLVVSACGILVSIVVSLLAERLQPVQVKSDIEKALKIQLIASTILVTPVLLVACFVGLPNSFSLDSMKIHNYEVFLCIAAGLWSGLAIGFITEYFTSHSYA